MSSPSQFVLTFLSSVGKRQEAEYYLRLFRELPKASFAVIAAEPLVFDRAPGSVVEPLRFLGQLGLFPVLASGLLGESQGVSAADLEAWLVDEGMAVARVTPSAPDWVARTRDELGGERAVIADFSGPPTDERFAALGDLLADLSTRKLAILRSDGGLGPKEAGRLSLNPTHHLVTSESGISVINLRSDFETLVHGGYLTSVEGSLLERVSALHQRAPQLLTSIASPLNLLRELFTVRGAGTLVKTGSTIVKAQDYAELDLGRLTELLQDTFGRRLRPEFLQRRPLSVYLEANLRGVAIVKPGAHGAFLTKFAVNRKAQGEGIGRDLWEAMLRDHPAVYWRARVKNPVSGWYQGECDGMHREGPWRVFWRGIESAHVPEVIADALGRPDDFEEALT